MSYRKLTAGQVRELLTKVPFNRLVGLRLTRLHRDGITIECTLRSDLAVAGVLLLRRREPTRQRPYRVWCYPWVPIFYLTAMGGILIVAFVNRPGPSLAAVLTVAAGILAYGCTYGRGSLLRPTDRPLTVERNFFAIAHLLRVDSHRYSIAAMPGKKVSPDNQVSTCHPSHLVVSKPTFVKEG